MTFRRILLKLSGEALAGASRSGIDPAVIRRIGHEIAGATRAGVEVAVVIGGGNLFRGAELHAAGLQRVTGDHMGMLATLMNALAFKDVLAVDGVKVAVLSALEVHSVVGGYSRAEALERLGDGEVVVFGAGTGNPFFTTDSAACLRAIEIDADVVLKATKVDGIYDADPVTNPGARRFDTLSYDDVIARDLRVMDLTAVCLCRDYDMPLVVFDMNERGALTRIVQGDTVGTRIVS